MPNRHSDGCGRQHPLRVAASAAALMLAACASTEQRSGAPRRDEYEDSDYAVRYFALTGSPRIAEPGEKELRLKGRHDRAASEAVVEGEYGVSERLQIDVEVPYVWNHSAPDDGVPAVEVGTKVALREDPRRLAIAMAALVGIPVENEHTTTEVQTLFAQRLDDVQLNATAAIEWDVDETVYPWSCAGAVTAFSDTVRPTLEIFGERNLAYIAPGAVWSLGDGMEAAIAVPMRLHGDAESIGVAFSFLIEW